MVTVQIYIYLKKIRCLARSTDVPDTGLFGDLLWFDLNKDTLECREIDHGVLLTFGAEVVTGFLTLHKIALIGRGYLSYISELQRFRTIAYLKFFFLLYLWFLSANLIKNAFFFASFLLVHTILKFSDHSQIILLR